MRKRADASDDGRKKRELHIELEARNEDESAAESQDMAG